MVDSGHAPPDRQRSLGVNEPHPLNCKKQTKTIMPVPGYDGGESESLDPIRTKKKASRREKAPSGSSHLDHNPHLLEAIIQGKFRVVRRLLESKANPNYQGGENQVTPLMLACEISDDKAREAILEMLLKKGAEVNLQDMFGKTALMRAVLSDDVITVKTLLKNGAELNMQDKYGNIALSYAAKVGSEKCTRVLVMEGKRKSIDIDFQNLQGLTPLLIASQEGHLETAHLLVEDGASLNKRDLEHFMNAQDWMKLSGIYSTQDLEFLSPSGKKRNYYRQQRLKKGIKTLIDYFPHPDNLDGAESPNVFTIQRNEPPSQFPTLQEDSSDTSKSMFDISACKKQTSPLTVSLGLGEKKSSSSITFSSVSSVKTDLYKSSYLSKRQSLLQRNSKSEGYHEGALAPIATNRSVQLTTPTDNKELPSIKNARLPPIKK